MNGTRVNDAESETVQLKAATETIDQLVSPSLFDLHGTDPESSIVFHEENSQRLFNILLVDILSPMDSSLAGASYSVLEGLEKISGAPKLVSEGSSVASLRSAVHVIHTWLNQQVTVSVHLPSIERTVEIVLQRREFIDICGNISKHSFTRLTWTATKLQKILSRNGVELADREELLVLDDFYDRFHTDILNYHSTTIIEMLNNVRWGIHEYLRPEYQRALVTEDGDPSRYSYKYPSSITSQAAKTWYWELMNEVRSGPPVKRFVGTKWLKVRY